MARFPKSRHGEISQNLAMARFPKSRHGEIFKALLARFLKPCYGEIHSGIVRIIIN
jgi:hypothetical protein